MKIIKMLAILVMAVSLGIICLYTTSMSYLYCSVMEPMWMKAKTRWMLWWPKTVL